MKNILIMCLCCTLALPLNASGYGYGLYREDNPFVEAMLRMMEIFGLIDRTRLPLGAPYLPAYGQQLTPALGGMYGLGGYPGMSPLAGPGVMPGFGGWPGGGFPAAGGVPGNFGAPAGYGAGSAAAGSGYLDGAWELNTGGFVIISGNRARLFLSRDRYQDFSVVYDRSYLWWSPRGKEAASRYRYQLRNGGMILRDSQGNYLLLRRRR